MTPKGIKNVRVRFPPSPTGLFHMGGARTALFNWIFARQQKGVFLLRIEDTDKERSKKEFEEGIVESLEWLGIDWDEGLGRGGPHEPYRQSERTTIYRKYLEKLLKEGSAYLCYCTKEELDTEQEIMKTKGLAPKYSGKCRTLTAPPTGKSPQVIRFKTPEVKVEFNDMIRGTVTFDMALTGDFVIAKDIHSPLYNFAVVVDDAEMEITHVLRGEEHISNTPKQILIQEALGFSRPQYAHLPLVLSADRKKLSKRYTETSLLMYRDEGYLPEAIVNFLILLGWHPQDNQEVFTKEELIKKFDLSRVQKAGAFFDLEKLAWLNHEHIKRLSDEALLERVLPYLEEGSATKSASKELLLKTLRAVRDRIKTLKDFATLAEFFFILPNYNPTLLLWEKAETLNAKEALEKSLEIIENSSEMAPVALKTAFNGLFNALGRGSVLWPLRVALSGLAASPDPFVIIETLGKDESMRRVRQAIAKL